MNGDLDFDRVVTSWLAAGAERAPADDVAAALRTAAHTRQRHSLLGRRARVGLSTFDPRWMAAGLVLAVSVGAALAVGHGPAEAASRTVTANDFPWAAAAPAPALDAVAFVARLPPGAPEELYWRAAAYDTFDLGGWRQSDVREVEVPTGASLPSGVGERPDGSRSESLRVVIEPVTFRAPVLLSPGRPLSVNADATVRLVGDPGSLAAVELRSRAPAPYIVEAEVSTPDSGSSIGDGLRAAGQDYPAGIVDQYTAVPPGALGPDASLLLEAVLDSTPERSPYDLAVAVESTLRGGQFKYRVDPDALACADPSVVECLARLRAGYCLHYASTMAILLRAALPDDPIPTRLVQGFLPGVRSAGTETVTQSSVHAWVEVYFPGFGWMPFDPTPGGTLVPLPRPSGG